MPKIRDNTTGETLVVSDDYAAQLASSDPRRFSVQGPVNVTDQHGGAASQSVLPTDTQRGVRTESGTEAAARTREAAEDARYGHGILNKIEGGTGAFLKGLSAGLVSPWEKEQEHTSGLITGPAEFLGMAAPVLLTDGASLGADAAEGGSMLARAAELTPAGLAAAGGRAAAEALPGAGKIAMAAKAGAAEMGLYNFMRPFGDAIAGNNPDLSAEQVIGSVGSGIVVGGLTGGGLAALSRAYDGGAALLGKLRRADEGLVAPGTYTLAEKQALEAERARVRYDESGHDSLEILDEPEGGIGGTQAFAGKRPTDEAIRLHRDAGRAYDAFVEIGDIPPGSFNRAGDQAAVEAVNRGMESAGYLRDVMERMKRGELPLADYHKTAELIWDVEKGARAARELSPELARTLPDRWSDAAIAQRTEMLSGLDRSPGTTAEREAQNLAYSMADWSAPEAAETSKSLNAHFLLKLGGHLPTIGPIIRSMAKGPIGTVAAVELLLHGGGALHAAATAVPAALGTVTAGRVLRAMFRDPQLGGILGASAADVLGRARLHPDDRPSPARDPRVALRRLADRARRVDPASVAASVTQRVGASAAVPAAVAAAAGQAAARRHQLIRSILDASDPPSATPAETLLGRPLPSHAAAARAADGLRAIWHPDAAALMAVAGRLTPRAMAAAAAAYPQTAASLRQRLLAALGATDFRRLPMAKRRAIEAILGPALGGPPPSAAYASAMAASVSRKSAPSPGGPPPAPSGQLPPAAMAPSERAAHPGEGR